MSSDDASLTPNPTVFPVASASSSSSSSRPRAPPLSQAGPLSASIPSLRRRAAEGQGEKAASSNSVNERLARARQQAARRPPGPIEDEDGVAAAVGSSAPARSQPAARGTSTHTAATSASARAGLAYLAASALRTQDLKEARRNTALRRQLAGPVPPRSWKGEFLAGAAAAGGAGGTGGRGNGTGGSSVGAKVQDVRQKQGLLAANEEETEEQVVERAQERRRQLQPWSVSHPLLPPCPSYGSAQRATSTLRDICLSLILEILATHTCSSGLLDQTTRLEIEEDAACLPGHLKERIVALAARSGARCTMNDEAFERLYFSPLVWGEVQDEEGEGDRHESEAEAKTLDGLVEGSDGGESDDWERGSDDIARPSPDPAQGTQPHCWPSLDLSYAQLRQSTVRKLLLGPPPATEGPLPNGALTTLSSNVTLRYLSLAGQTSAGSPGLLTKSTFKLLASSLPNLEHLCLAGQHLSFGPSPSSKGAGRSADSAPLPWPSLWRGCRKLRLLDLSYTMGLGSAAAALVRSTVRDNGVTLPRLDELLLKRSDADLAWYNSAGGTSGGGGKDVRGNPLPLFLTPSHARYWADVREKRRGRSVSTGLALGDARDATLDTAISFAEEDFRSSGAASIKQLASVALLMDTFRGRTGGGKERWCEIWI